MSVLITGGGNKTFEEEDLKTHLSSSSQLLYKKGIMRKNEKEFVPLDSLRDIFYFLVLA